MLSDTQILLPAIYAANDRASRINYPLSMLSTTWVEANAAGAPYIWRATGAPDRIVLYLHTWNGDRQQARTQAELQTLTNAVIVSPEFYGPNKTPLSCGSDEALAQIATVIREVRFKTGLQRVYLIAASGGTIAAAGLMALYPRLIHRASLWVPIYDLATWYGEVAGQETFQADMVGVFGHAPTGDEDADYRYRSASGRLAAFNNVCTIYVNGGTNDATAPIHHAHDLSARLLSLGYPGELIVSCDWNMGHEIKLPEAIKQLFIE